MSNNADWAALNAAQQAALIVWCAGWLLFTFMMILRGFQRNWPMLLVFVLLVLSGSAGAAVLILALGAVPE